MRDARFGLSVMSTAGNGGSDLSCHHGVPLLRKSAEENLRLRDQLEADAARANVLYAER